MFGISELIAAAKRLAASLNHLSETVEAVDTEARARLGLSAGASGEAPLQVESRLGEIETPVNGRQKGKVRS